VGNCRFVQTDLKHLSQAMREMGGASRPDVVITDPPRAGMHAKGVEALRQVAPRRIVYVSCNPASLARDAKALCEGGLYRLGRVQPVDLFPHTYHIESVAALERADAAH
jgi:23S rRNA (uracil1939-C5)-methyltransferase